MFQRRMVNVTSEDSIFATSFFSFIYNKFKISGIILGGYFFRSVLYQAISASSSSFTILGPHHCSYDVYDGDFLEYVVSTSY